MDLSAMISSAGCECMNESDDHPLAHALTSKGGYLESDCDEQVSGVDGLTTQGLFKLKIHLKFKKELHNTCNIEKCISMG